MPTSIGSTITLQDLTTPTGSRLWAGSKIYCPSTSMTYGMKVNIGNKPITLAQVSNTSTDLGSDNLNFSRRKGYTQYVAINNPTINLSGTWTREAGSQAGGYLLLTPLRLMKMALTGHTLYLSDERLVRNFMTSDGTYTGLFTGSGIPVVIEDVSFNMTSETENAIDFSISLIEDKEVTDVR